MLNAKSSTNSLPEFCNSINFNGSGLNQLFNFEASFKALLYFFSSIPSMEASSGMATYFASTSGDSESDKSSLSEYLMLFLDLFQFP